MDGYADTGDGDAPATCVAGAPKTYPSQVGEREGAKPFYRDSLCFLPYVVRIFRGLRRR